MSATKMIVLSLVVALGLPALAPAGTAGRNDAPGVGSMQMGFATVESRFHNPDAAQYSYIEPYGKVTMFEYRDALKALATLRTLTATSTPRAPTTPSEWAALFSQAPFNTMPYAVAGLAKLGVSLTNYAKSFIKPMYARNPDGSVRQIVAIDQTKPVNKTGHTETRQVVVACPSQTESVYLPACAWCYGWSSVMTSAEFNSAWQSGAITSSGAGASAYGVQPTYCCTPQPAGTMTRTPAGPCYEGQNVFVYDNATVSVVRWPAQLVAINGEMVWVVTLPNNQISVGGNVMNANEFVNGAPLNGAGQNPSTTTLTMPLDPVNGAFTTVSGTAPPVADPAGAAAKPSGFNYTAPNTR